MTQQGLLTFHGCRDGQRTIHRPDHRIGLYLMDVDPSTIDLVGHPIVGIHLENDRLGKVQRIGSIPQDRVSRGQLKHLHAIHHRTVHIGNRSCHLVLHLGTIRQGIGIKDLTIDLVNGKFHAAQHTETITTE